MQIFGTYVPPSRTTKAVIPLKNGISAGRSAAFDCSPWHKPEFLWPHTNQQQTRFFKFCNARRTQINKRTQKRASFHQTYIYMFTCLMASKILLDAYLCVRAATAHNAEERKKRQIIFVVDTPPGKQNSNPDFISACII